MTTRTIEGYEHTCQRCGHIWKSFVEDPVACKKCKTRLWKTKAGEKARGRPRTLPKELSEDVTRYNREYARKRRAKPEPETVYVADE